jgi:uncharacterized protein YprB with RNaseH-like and TPR domain
MLEKTFVHIPGVGYTTEQRLWARGIGSWYDALEHVGTPGSLSAARWGLGQDHCRESLGSLQAGDYRYFARALAGRDQWRACSHFRSGVGYLDIETDGGYYASSITVIGIYDGVRVKRFIKGENLQDFAEELERYSLLVTFNGTTFDLPLLRRAFPAAPWDQLHVDLRYALAKLGYRGGLKQIEREVGLVRDLEIRGLAGDDAILLWQQYRRGSAEALELLLAYNTADVENLETLLDLALPRLQAHAESGSTL